MLGAFGFWSRSRESESIFSGWVKHKSTYVAFGPTLSVVLFFAQMEATFKKKNGCAIPLQSSDRTPSALKTGTEY